MINGVAIYGGFPKTGNPVWEDRDPNTYITILSGDLLGNDNPTTPVKNLNDDPNRADNCYHVFYHPYYTNLDATAILDGFTITAGNADGYSGRSGYGGGMYNWGSNPTVSNCTFTSNSAGIGGGMDNDYSNSIVTGCTFSGNLASSGSGMYNEYFSSPTVSNCTFSGNSAGRGGGMYNLVYSSPTVTGCTFSGNSADSKGGGMCNAWDSSPTLSNCTFTGNLADGGGGGMYNASGNPTLINCILWGNSATDSPQIYGGGTVTYSDVQGGYPGLGNINIDPLFLDPGQWDSNGTVGDPSDDFWVDGDYHLKSEGWRWARDEPRWDWDYDDVTSRCIDAGNPGVSLGDEPIILDVDPTNEFGINIRVNMGFYGGTAEASIGPYDWSLLGDLTNDGMVNFVDFAGQAADWQVGGIEQSGDLDRNGIVDIADFVMLIEDWLRETTWY